MPDVHRLTAGDLGGPLGERATLVQFASAFCAPCRATRMVLRDVAARVPGVEAVEVDAESRLDLVRALEVRGTPTVLVLEADGRIVFRAGGTPQRSDVLRALALALDVDHAVHGDPPPPVPEVPGLAPSGRFRSRGRECAEPGDRTP